MDSMNTRSLRRHSNLSYAETSDLDFDSGMDTEDPTGSFGESGLVLQNPSPSSASERMVDDNLVTKKRISRACDYCRRKKCKCTGEKPCQECRNNDQVCLYTVTDNSAPHRTYPHQYVHALEQNNQQLNEALRELHMRITTKQDLSACPLEYSELVTWLARTTMKHSPSSPFSPSVAPTRPSSRTLTSRRQIRSRRTSSFRSRNSKTSPEARVEPFDEQALIPLQSSQTENPQFERTVHTESRPFDLVDIANLGTTPSILPEQYVSSQAPHEPSYNTMDDGGNGGYYYNPQQSHYGQHADYYPESQQLWTSEFDWQHIREQQLHSSSTGHDRAREEFQTEYHTHYPTPTSQETGSYSPLNGRIQ